MPPTLLLASTDFLPIRRDRLETLVIDYEHKLPAHFGTRYAVALETRDRVAADRGAA